MFAPAYVGRKRGAKPSDSLNFRTLRFLILRGAPFALSPHHQRAGARPSRSLRRMRRRPHPHASQVRNVDGPVDEIAQTNFECSGVKRGLKAGAKPGFVSGRADGGLQLKRAFAPDIHARSQTSPQPLTPGRRTRKRMVGTRRLELLTSTVSR
jgi:hypothetical protein